MGPPGSTTQPFHPNHHPNNSLPGTERFMRRVQGRAGWLGFHAPPSMQGGTNNTSFSLRFRLMRGLLRISSATLELSLRASDIHVSDLAATVVRQDRPVLSLGKAPLRYLRRATLLKGSAQKAAGGGRGLSNHVRGVCTGCRAVKAKFA